MAAPDRPTGEPPNLEPLGNAPPRWTFAVATVVWALVVGFLVRLFFATVVAGLAGRAALDWLARSPAGLAVAAATIQLALFGMAELRSRLMPELRNDLLRALRNRRSHWLASVLLVLGLAPFANGCGMLVARLARADLSAMEHVGDLVRRSTPGELTLLALALAGLPALIEESIFRGLVLGTLDDLRPGVALLISAAAFGVFHMDLAQAMATFILGAGFGFIVQTTGSLLGAIVAHATYNLVVLLSQRWLATTSPPQLWQLVEMLAGLLIAGAACVRLHRLRAVEQADAAPFRQGLPR